MPVLGGGGSGGGGGGISLPAGGSENDALIKQSATDGDADWEATASASNADPQRAGVAASGSGTAWARDDHVHPYVPRSFNILLGAAGGSFDTTWLGIGSGTGPSNVDGRLFVTPVVFSKPANVKIACWIPTGGSAGAVIRFGLWDNGTDDLPGTLVSDLGTVVATGTGYTPSGTAAVVVPGRRYWAGLVCQGAPVTLPQLRSVNFGSGSDFIYLPGSGGTVSVVNAYYYNGKTGALATLSGSPDGKASETLLFGFTVV
jgi:hypothetical protein